ncbi:MAG TPA: hypothetical protein VF503_23370 [Sphingobium sp.]|uniref:hypothetical protein n=1 Tax=Sphingobium sp. TaxID=1912891 RepID=UPI002ED14A7C
MGTLKLDHGTAEYQWATDVAFDGLRLEILSTEGEMIFDVSIPEGGPITVNTFGKEVAADIMLAAIETARGAR